MRISLIVVATVILFSSFLNLDDNRSCKDLSGIWVFSDYEDGEVRMLKADRFKSDEWGMQFKSDGQLVRRQNEGWCGTPPISYANFDGVWECTSDSTLKLTYAYWGGIAEEEIKIVMLNSAKFSFIRLSQEFIEKNSEE